MTKCPRCGRINPDTSIYCSQCAAQLKFDPPNSKRTRWQWLGWPQIVTYLIVGIVVATVVIALNGSNGGHQVGAPIADTATPLVDYAAHATPIELNTPVDTGTPVPETDTVEPTETPQPTPTPQPTETSGPTQAPTASPAQRADLLSFAGQVEGLRQECIGAANTATASLNAVSKGGDQVQAYGDAQTASDTCKTAWDDLAIMTVPDDLGGYSLDTALGDDVVWASDESAAWSDVDKFLQNPQDLASQADLKKQTDEAGNATTEGEVLLVAAFVQMKVPVDKITPVVPTPGY